MNKALTHAIVVLLVLGVGLFVVINAHHSGPTSQIFSSGLTGAQAFENSVGVERGSSSLITGVLFLGVIVALGLFMLGPKHPHADK